MGKILQFPSNNDREHGFHRQKILPTSEPVFLDINEFLNLLNSLRLPALVKTEAVQLYPKLKKLPSIEKLACRIFMQDLITYGKPNSDAALDFQNSNPKLSAKIQSFNIDIQRSIYHILGNYVADNYLVDALRSTRHLFGRVMGYN